MTATTSIKVPKSLRDRIATRAERDSVSLATVIEQAVAAVEERDFWSAVRAENRPTAGTEGRMAVADGTVRDDLHDDDDQRLSLQGGW